MTNSEQAIREFAEKWGFSQDKTDEGFLIDNDRTKQCLSDLTALIEEHYVAKEEHEKLVNAALQNKPQPTAEGAEEILTSLIKSLGEPTKIHNHIYEIRPYTVEGKTEWWMFHNGVGSGELLAQWLQNFATLHAQRIAEKMVSERLGNQPLLKKIFDRLNDIDPDLLASIMDQIERESSHD